MFKSQISNQNGMPYEDSLEENWIKWNLVKEGRVLTICMWANGCLGQASVLTICDEYNKKPRYTFDWQW